MILPIRTDSPLRSTPWMNWLLILANGLVFLLEMLYPSIRTSYVLSPRDPHLVNYFTYAFLHEGWAHIIGNMLFLYIFGNNVNDKLGNLGYLAFYLAGGVFAGVGYVVTQSMPNPVLGASGAVAAVTGAYLVLFPRSSITIIYFFYLIGTFEIPSIYFIAFFFLKDLFFSFTESTGVAHTAHVGGTLFGFVVGLALLFVKLLPRDQFDILALMGRWNKRRQYQSMVRQGYDPFGRSTVAREPRHEEMDAVARQAYALRGRISEAISRHDLAAAAQLYLELLALDPQQVLSRQAQLDVANQLAHQQLYPQAASAYEQFLRQYPNYDQSDQIQLMLGLIYSRYLQQYDKAREHLNLAVQKSRGDRQAALARDELGRIPQ
ncbi:MAG: rhomboid family intramembrane serine protease [Phycisphaerales bacterium]|nr:rhomboid family intramembrane serine protease [Phycisphaerales bacterium]